MSAASGPGRPESPRALACRLDAAGLADRREQARGLRSAVQETRELPDGLAFRFPGDRDRLLAVAEFIAAERRCCPFFAFTLELEPDEGPIWLTVRGPEGAKELLREVLLGGTSGRGPSSARREPPG